MSKNKPPCIYLGSWVVGPSKSKESKTTNYNIHKTTDVPVGGEAFHPARKLLKLRE